MAKKFFSTLNYSSCNEDAYTELEALDIKAGDRVACITGSGDRALHILLGDPDQVFAFDANQVQNFLLELKMAAIRHLDYDNYARFLGLVQAGKDFRSNTYKRLEKDLSDKARDWFKTHSRYIDTGILYTGRWERYFNMAAWNLRLWRGNKINRIFSFNSIEDQRKFVADKWDTRLWRAFLVVSFNRFFFRWIFGDPGFYSQVDGIFTPGRYIHKRLDDYMMNHLAVESFMLALIFKGRFFSSRHYPPYLSEDYFQTLKSRLDRITIIIMTLDELLDADYGRECNKFSLSDVSSFLDMKRYSRLFHRLSEMPGRRFCLRDFLTRRDVPQDCPNTIRFFPELQQELTSKDRSIGYSFIIGETL